MSTANFLSMKEFPLVCAEDPMMKICPNCGLGQNGDNCENCGHDLSNEEEIVDEIACDDIVHEMERWAEKMNGEQLFFHVSVASGYYCGVQFYIEDEYRVEDMENEETQYEFGMCRSLALRKYATAANKIRKMLQKAKKEIGLIELSMVAQFSNGEAMYVKVG